MVSIFSSVTGYRCAQVTLGGREQRAKLKEELDKKKMFRRNINFLRREGAVGLNHLRAEVEVLEALPEFCEAHVARFLATGRISNLVRSSRRAFLTELARGLSKIDALTLTCLTLGNKAIAWNYGFQFQGSWFWYQPTFDSRLEEHSPGYIMLSKIVMEACDHPRTARAERLRTRVCWVIDDALGHLIDGDVVAHGFELADDVVSRRRPGESYRRRWRT